MWLESAGTYKYLINSLFTTIKPNDFVIVEDPNNQVYGSLSDITYNFTISDNAWVTATNTGTAFQWGGGRWYIDGTDSKIATLTSPDIPQVVYSVSISHRWNFEFCCDGGQVQYSTDNGTTWTELPFNETNPYSNGGSTAWAGAQSSIVTSTAKLSLSNNPLSNFKLRLRAFWDGSVLNTNPNWQIYSVSLSPLLSGKVNYVYRINKYEIMNNEYCLFLNSVDPYGSNPNSIYNSQMSSSARGGITLESTRPSGYLYRVKTNMGDKPANFVSWFSAARFCNWLHNGAKTYLISDASATAPQNIGAYTVSTATSSTVPISPNPGAKYRIPTLNEWIKAGYYKGDGINTGYWAYPTQYDTEPQCVSNVTSNGYAVIFPLYQTRLAADIITDLPQPTSVYSSRLAIDALTTNLDGLLIDSRLSADLAIIEKVWRENNVISRLACDICIGDIVLPVITIQQQPPAIIKQTSSSATITVSASVTLDQTLSYQWQKKDFGSSAFQNIVGATSSVLSLTGLNAVDDDRDQYRCKISATGGASDVFSSATEIIFNTIISVTQQPENTTSSTGSASFSVSATTSPSTILWYQWEVAKPNDPSNFTLITSPQNLNPVLSLSNLIYEDNHNDIYRCKLVTEDNTGFLYSNTATLQIQPAAITITSQPPANFKPSSGNASISVQASIDMGGTLSYQWQRKPNGGSYADIVGATGATLSLSGLVEATNDLDSYKCVVSGNRGASTVTSNASMLVFNTLITITTEPQDIISPDGNATFLCEASSDPPSAVLYYIWQKAESSDPLVFTDLSAPNNTNNTLSLTGLTFANDNGDKYRCIVVASDSTGQAVSNTATLTLPDPSAIPTITIIQQPKNTLVTNLNNKVAISGLATVSTGATPTYTWEYLNSIASGVSDTVLMNNANWEPIVSNKILFNFDGAIQDSGDFTHTITNNNATINTTTKKYGSGSLFCANGNVRISPSSGFATHKFALNSDFTIEGWFYFTVNDDGYQPLICADAGSDASAWVLIMETNNTLAFYGLAAPEWSGSWTTSVTTSFTPDTSSWYHICVMRQNRTIKMFVDGIEVGSTTQSSNGDPRFVGGDITLGGYDYFPDGGKNFNGYIDDVRIVHGKAVYNMLGFTPPSIALTKHIESVTSISKHFIYDLTIANIDDPYWAWQGFFSPPCRDKRIRLKVTSPGAETTYSKIIRYVFPVYGYYSYFGPEDSFFFGLPDTGQTEIVNGVTYNILTAYTGDDLLTGIYDDSQFFASAPPADTSWYNDNASSVTLEYSADGINWTLADSGGFKYGNFGPSVVLDIPTQPTPEAIYYRLRFFDTWPYETNNGTDSTPASTYFYQLFGGPVNFKIDWQTP